MTAKEMFEELGYKLQCNDKDIIAFKYKYALGGYKEIIFSKKSDGLYIDYSFEGKQLTFVSYKEVKAINKQAEELRWNE